MISGTPADDLVHSDGKTAAKAVELIEKHRGPDAHGNRRRTGYHF